LAIKKCGSSAEFTCFGSNSAVCLRAVLRKDCVVTKSDTILAFVEIVGRHGDALARHAVYRWPACVGRGYDNEVILDDPFVAARHVRIEPGADGRFALTDLQSLNGIALVPSGRRVSEAAIGPDDLVRLGQTQIRVRAPTCAVRPEVPLRATAINRRPVAFGAMAAVLLGLTFWHLWVVATHQEERAFLALSIVLIAVAAGIWVSIWSLVSRTLGGRWNFSAHGFVACAGLTALALWDTVIEYVSFGFDAHLKYAGTAGAAAIFAFMLYGHLRLNSRGARRKLGIAAVIVSVTTYGVAVGFQMASERARPGVQNYDRIVKAPFFLMVPGVTPEAFISEGEALRRKVDALARTER
jgi:hypothetical protein